MRAEKGASCKNPRAPGTRAIADTCTTGPVVGLDVVCHRPADEAATAAIVVFRPRDLASVDSPSTEPIGATAMVGGDARRDASSSASKAAVQSPGPNEERKASRSAGRVRVTDPSPSPWLLAAGRAHHFAAGALVAPCGVRRPPTDIAPWRAPTCAACLDAGVTS